MLETSTAATQTAYVLICLPLSFCSSTALGFLLFGSAAAPDSGTRTRRPFSSGAFIRDALPILRLCRSEIRWQQPDIHTESISTSAHSGKTWVKKEICTSFFLIKNKELKKNYSASPVLLEQLHPSFSRWQRPVRDLMLLKVSFFSKTFQRVWLGHGQ